MCAGDNANASAQVIKYQACLAGSNDTTGTNNTNSFSSMFPDTPPQVIQFQSAYTNYINGTNNTDSNALVYWINGLSNQVGLLKQFQSNIISTTPEYTNKSASQMFLSNLSTTSMQTSTLQLKFDIVNQNVEHVQSKINGNLTNIIFYTYTSITILLGVLSIGLITYFVYMYMNIPASMTGGHRNDFFSRNRRDVR
jgi:hypothetical protein